MSSVEQQQRYLYSEAQHMTFLSLTLAHVRTLHVRKSSVILSVWRARMKLSEIPQ